MRAAVQIAAETNIGHSTGIGLYRCTTETGHSMCSAGDPVINGTGAAYPFAVLRRSRLPISRDFEIRVKPWWLNLANGKLMLALHYGTRSIELAKGKNAIEIGSDLITASDATKSARLP